MEKKVAYPGQMLDLTFGGSGGRPPERLSERSLTQWINTEHQPIDKVSLPSFRDAMDEVVKETRQIFGRISARRRGLSS